MAARRLGAVALLLGVLTGVLAAGCFEPRRPGCAFSCVADGRCPEGYACGGDGLCHRDDGQGTCDLPPQHDAAPDGASDGPVDAAPDGPGEAGSDAPADAVDGPGAPSDGAPAG